MTFRFDGKVAVVTGAAGGLGRQYALFFASRGAKVLVNDLGSEKHGQKESSQEPADKVVAEIKAKGGVAVANYDSVINGQKIIKAAIDNFGRIDILVNNAGILKDISMQKLKKQDWDLIIGVHLSGTFSCARAAWNIMREQGYGRIVNTASAAGLYGNFGQANYSAAKLGTHGFTMALAKEGQKKNVRVNTIAPLAASRLLAEVMPQEALAALNPALVAPFVGYLCHESCSQTGSVFQVGGGFAAKVRWQRSEGAFFDPQKMTIEDVANKWKQVTGYDRKNEYPLKPEQTFSKIMKYRSSLSKPKAKL